MPATTLVRVPGFLPPTVIHHPIAIGARSNMSNPAAAKPGVATIPRVTLAASTATIVLAIYEHPLDVCSSRAISGKATVAIVTSISDMNVPAPIAINGSHLPESEPWPSVLWELFPL
jgi:hypothetical protein